MSKKPYLPSADTEKVLWTNNFAAKLPAYEITLNIDPATIASVQNDDAMFEYVVQQVESVKTDKQEMVAYKNAVRDGNENDPAGPLPTFGAGGGVAPPALVNQGIFTRIRKLVQTIKAHPNYTTAIGEDLGIIGNEETFDPSTYQTTLKAEAFPGHVTVSFTKGKVEAVNLYGKEPADNTWEFLATLLHSPYMDSRP